MGNTVRDNLVGAESLAQIAEQYGTDKVRYCSTYENYLAPLRHRPVKFFEIGVGGYSDPNVGGASVRMWREYFQKGTIYALDFYDKSVHEQDRIRIFKGDQTNSAVLHAIVAEMGRVDVVLDDGSHVSSDVIKSFEVLFPLLAPGGIYIIEDIGTSYWRDYGGNEDLLDQGTSMAFFKRLADGLQFASFKHEYLPKYADCHASFVHFYVNLVIVGKKCTLMV